MFHCFLRPICRHYQCIELRTLFRNFPNIYCVSLKPELQKKSSDKDTVTSSTIVIQDGLNFQELPVIVKKTKCLNILPEDATINLQPQILNTPESKKLKENLDFCLTITELFDFLETVPEAEVTPIVASYALKCIADLYCNAEYRNEGKMSEKNNIMSFTRSAVVVKLFETVCESGDFSVVLEGLTAGIRCEESSLVEKFINECLLRISDGKASVSEICEFARLVSTSEGKYLTVLDKLWCPLADKFNEIDCSNLVKLYRLLPLLKHSRSVVFNLLEKRTYVCWWQLNVNDVNEIMFALMKLKFRPNKLLMALSKWVNVNIHVMSESEFAVMMSGFEEMDYIDDNVKRAMERYVKAKYLSILDPLVFTRIMSLCLHCRFQSSVILESVAQYFIRQGSELSAFHIVCLVKPFGLLNYVPSDLEFYRKLEEVMMNKFAQYRPDDLIELLLSCTYVQKYPLNFVKKIFNPHFLERLSSIQDTLQLYKAHNNLRLLDMTMTLECRRYRGPKIPRNKNMQTLQRDGRITKLITRLSDVMSEILGGYKYFASNKWLQQYPLSEMYIVDFVIHFNRDGNVMPLDERARIGKRKAIIIHLPEHYCHNSQNLMGDQAAKARLLQKIGYSVVHFDYEELNRLYHKTDELTAVLKKKILEI